MEKEDEDRLAAKLNMEEQTHDSWRRWTQHLRSEKSDEKLTNEEILEKMLDEWEPTSDRTNLTGKAIVHEKLEIDDDVESSDELGKLARIASSYLIGLPIGLDEEAAEFWDKLHGEGNHRYSPETSEDEGFVNIDEEDEDEDPEEDPNWKENSKASREKTPLHEDSHEESECESTAGNYHIAGPEAMGKRM